MRVVPAFDVAEDGEPGFGVRREAMLGEALDVEGRVEALRHGVIVGIAARARRRPHPEQLAPLAGRKHSIWRALIRVVNDVGRVPLRRRHIQRVDDEGQVQRVAHAPPDDAPTEDIEHDGEIFSARHRRDVCDVGDPKLIRGGRGKGPFREIRGRWGLRRLAPRSRRPTSLGDALQAIVAHRARGDDARFRHAEYPLSETPNTRPVVPRGTSARSD